MHWNEDQNVWCSVYDKNMSDDKQKEIKDIILIRHCTQEEKAFLLHVEKDKYTIRMFKQIQVYNL